MLSSKKSLMLSVYQCACRNHDALITFSTQIGLFFLFKYRDSTLLQKVDCVQMFVFPSGTSGANSQSDRSIQDPEACGQTSVDGAVGGTSDALPYLIPFVHFSGHKLQDRAGCILISSAFQLLNTTTISFLE